MGDVASVFKALSDETRLRIVKLLEGGELCVCDIVAALGMVQPKVSFHLNVLREAGLLRDRKDGRWTHYSLDDSDIFMRFLLLSVCERMSGESASRDGKRLADFLKVKAEKALTVSRKSNSRYCGGVRC